MKEPFMNTMFPNYVRPWERDFKKRTTNVTLFSHYEHTPDEKYEYGRICESCGNDMCRNWECENYKENDPELLEIWEERRKTANLTLQDIIDMLPAGVTPDQVRFTLSLDVGAMSVEGAEIEFYYSKDFPDDPEGFKKAKEEYDRNYQAYLLEKEKYDQWVKEQEIKALEAKLAELKK